MSVTLKLPSWDLALEGPVRLAAAGLPIAPGVFVILAPRERTPGSYRILHAGETDNLADRCVAGHESYPLWLAAAERADDLRVAWRATPMLTSRERQFIVRAAIDQFDPPCNRADRMAGWMLDTAGPRARHSAG